MSGQLIKKLCEDVGSFHISSTRRNNVLKESNDNLPESINVTLRVLTANKVTRNFTYYPLESLRGRPSKGTGLHSYVRPYPVPILVNHDTYGEVYGRVYQKPELAKIANNIDGVVTYVSATAVITNPKAIAEIMSGRWYTVSNGARASAVNCSICNIDLTSEYCDHERGKYYKVDNNLELAYVVVGPLVNEEISFVTVPSDTESGVISVQPTNKAQESSDSSIISAHATYNGRSISLITESDINCGNIEYITKLPNKVGTFRFA